MSDPKDIPGRRIPPRAEPLQPDRIGGGDSGNQEPRQPDTAGKQKEQSDAALDNVRKGYD